MGAPSKLRLGGIARTSTRPSQSSTNWVPQVPGTWGPEIARTSTRPSQSNPKNGCPIQALLGWDSTNPQVEFVILRSPRRPKDRGCFSRPQPATKMGAPSKLRLGGIARTSTRPSQSNPKNGCPIQALLGWDSTNPQVEFVILRSPRRPKDLRLLLAPSTRHKNGCPIQASLGWDSTNLHPPLSIQHKTGCPRSLALGDLR